MTSAILNSQPLKVLIVGSLDPPADLRAVFLREHGLELDVAASADDARALYRANAYHLVLVDVRNQRPGEVSAFCEELRHSCPGQRIAFWVGPPKYLVETWLEETAAATEASRQWAETVDQLSEAA